MDNNSGKFTNQSPSQHSEIADASSYQKIKKAWLRSSAINLSNTRWRKLKCKRTRATRASSDLSFDRNRSFDRQSNETSDETKRNTSIVDFFEQNKGCESSLNRAQDTSIDATILYSIDCCSEVTSEVGIEKSNSPSLTSCDRCMSERLPRIHIESNPCHDHKPRLMHNLNKSSSKEQKSKSLEIPLSDESQGQPVSYKENMTTNEMQAEDNITQDFRDSGRGTRASSKEYSILSCLDQPSVYPVTESANHTEAPIIAFSDAVTTYSKGFEFHEASRQIKTKKFDTNAVIAEKLETAIKIQPPVSVTTQEGNSMLNSSSLEPKCGSSVATRNPIQINNTQFNYPEKLAVKDFSIASNHSLLPSTECDIYSKDANSDEDDAPFKENKNRRVSQRKAINDCLPAYPCHNLKDIRLCRGVNAAQARLKNSPVASQDYESLSALKPCKRKKDEIFSSGKISTDSKSLSENLPSEFAPTFHGQMKTVECDSTKDMNISKIEGQMDANQLKSTNVEAAHIQINIETRSQKSLQRTSAHSVGNGETSLTNPNDQANSTIPKSYYNDSNTDSPRSSTFGTNLSCYTPPNPVECRDLNHVYSTISESALREPLTYIPPLKTRIRSMQNILKPCIIKNETNSTPNEPECDFDEKKQQVPSDSLETGCETLNAIELAERELLTDILMKLDEEIVRH